jgi:general secretion pathway protein G
MSDGTGLGIGTLIAILAVGFLICSAIAGFFMWIGAKIARIEGATFGRSMGAAVAAAFASSLATLVLALFGLPGVGAFVGILVDILVIQSIYKTTFFKALICWLGYLVSFFIAAFISVALLASGGARPLAAKGAMQAIGSGLEKYRKDTGQYPTTEQGLRALVAAPAPRPAKWNGPYLAAGETLLTDPWSRPYVYRAPTAPSTSYLLRSTGPDGTDGTADDVDP